MILPQLTRRLLNPSDVSHSRQQVKAALRLRQTLPPCSRLEIGKSHHHSAPMFPSHPSSTHRPTDPQSRDPKSGWCEVSLGLMWVCTASYWPLSPSSLKVLTQTNSTRLKKKSHTIKSLIHWPLDPVCNIALWVLWWEAVRQVYLLGCCHSHTLTNIFW